ncbi:sugar O-acetyltransferase [uncultured Bacteroides sp.]|uniref:sugar O-acetyltransferase n=1 Tax=uncultured Bacteroides sp. TaxID=162156 RepID=UPI002613BFF7|nr:sugar O-acetyltransferase [uncultured Bacteroides sp.]
MTEFEKMRSSQLADCSDPEINESFRHCKTLLARFRMISSYHEEFRSILEDLIPGIPATSTVMPPFYCDHGNGIRLGEHVFINANCTFLDGAYITIGNHTLVGPGVQIYTPHHPIDYMERRSYKEYSYPVTIGEDCWIGGGAIILPGVTIGDRCIIGAGSVVTKDIPSDCIAVGNPAVVKRRLEKQD